MRSPTTVVRAAAVLGALAVIAGAFGAHGLRDVLTASRIETWQLAARYELVHAVALLALAAAWDRVGRPAIVAGFWVGGVVVFSGSLYALCLLDAGALGAITPVGGLLLIVGWAALAAPPPR